MQRPERSHTGAATVDVSESARLAMVQSLMNRGMSMHSAGGQSVWALTDECRKRGIAYEVQVARDADNQIQGVAVINREVYVDLDVPKDWTVETVEAWSVVTNFVHKPFVAPKK